MDAELHQKHVAQVFGSTPKASGRGQRPSNRAVAAAQGGVGNMLSRALSKKIKVARAQIAVRMTLHARRVA